MHSNKYISILILLLSWSQFGWSTTIDSDEERSSHEKFLNYVNLYDGLANEEPKNALLIAIRAHRFAVNDSPEDVAAGLNLIGKGYLNLSELDSAKSYFFRSLELAGQKNDTAMIAKANNNLGAVSFASDDYELGLRYFTTAAQAAEKSGDYEQAVTSYLNLGANLAAMNRLDSAEHFILSALRIAELLADSIQVTAALNNLGAINIEKGNIIVAESYLYRSIEIDTRSENYYGVCRSYRNLGEGFERKGLYSRAIEMNEKALTFAQLIQDPHLIASSYRGLYLCYKAMDKYSEAYANHKLYMEWTDTVNNKANQSALIEMQEKYDSEQTLKENQILEQENSIAQLETEKNKQDIANSNLIKYSSIGGVILFIGLAFSLYNRNKVKQRANDELQNAHAIIREKNEDITSSLAYASKIQEALLPTKENTTLFSDSLFMLRPKDIVSGDFFWYTEHEGKKIFTAVDCTGHGVPGAFMSMIGNTFLHEIINEKGITEPAQILNELRSKVVNALSSRDARKDGMDMAICCLDEQAMTLQYAGANNPLWYIQDGEIKEIKADKQPVGYMPEKDGPFTNHEIKITKGDKFYVFSDGYPDQFGGPKGKKFKYKQLRELIHSTSSKSMKEQKAILVETFENWMGDLEQIDDVCIVGVTV